MVKRCVRFRSTGINDLPIRLAPPRLESPGQAVAAHYPSAFGACTKLTSQVLWLSARHRLQKRLMSPGVQSFFF
jgi:hypothetical protein